ncbi:MAG: hypothetical protein FVQ83_10200 [Chloroflexi bacterium]|nr:hypothetical protein [Chloroflexota bacterium]
MSKFSIAPWVIARAAFEACAKIHWLLDSEVDVKKWVGRSLALRFVALRSQEKFANATEDKGTLSRIHMQMSKIEKVAVDLGYPLMQNDKGKRIGIAVPKPNMIDLMEKFLGAERLYRILSGIAHSDYETLSQISFVSVEEKQSGGVVKKRAIFNQIQKQLLDDVVITFSRAVWLVVRYFGFNEADLVSVFENRFDGLDLVIAGCTLEFSRAYGSVLLTELKIVNFSI